MPYRVIFLQEADQDVSEAIAWYRDIGEGLEQGFKSDLSTVIPILQENPYVYQEVFEGIRIGLTKRLKFRVIYEIEDRNVLILAVMHPKRHERRWKQRIPTQRGRR